MVIFWGIFEITPSRASEKSNCTPNFTKLNKKVATEANLTQNYQFHPTVLSYNFFITQKTPANPIGKLSSKPKLDTF